jgi:hypothetical protein
MLNKIKSWFKGVIENLLTWDKDSSAKEGVPVG